MDLEPECVKIKGRYAIKTPYAQKKKNEKKWTEN